jgi:hypothetical protein
MTPRRSSRVGENACSAAGKRALRAPCEGFRAQYSWLTPPPISAACEVSAEEALGPTRTHRAGSPRTSRRSRLYLRLSAGRFGGCRGATRVAVHYPGLCCSKRFEHAGRYARRFGLSTEPVIELCRETGRFISRRLDGAANCPHSVMIFGPEAAIASGRVADLGRLQSLRPATAARVWHEAARLIIIAGVGLPSIVDPSA